MGKLKRQICYDLQAGMLQMWKYYVLYIIIIILFTYSMYRENRFAVMENGFSWLDCVSGYFRGMYDSALLERAQLFRIPVEWFLFHMGYIFFEVCYPYHDYSERGYQFLIRSGNKAVWWLSKYIWSIMNAVLYCFIFYIITFFCIIPAGGQFIWKENDIWGLQLGDKNIRHIICILFVMPVMVSAALSTAALLLSFCWNQLGAILSIIVILVASAYWKMPFLIGNYSMLYRYDFNEHREGMQIIAGCLLCIAIMLLSGFLGYIVFKRQEFIKREGLRCI